MSAADSAETRRRVASHLQRRARWRWPEIVFWLAIPALIFALPSRAALINEILIAGLFALSLDLILGLTGIVSLGHAAFLGLGAYCAAILASKGFADPLLGLPFGAGVAAIVGLVTAPLLLRGGDLTRLMVTLGVSLMLGELANRNGWLTGGADGLKGIAIAPLLGLFRFDLFGRTAYLYCLVVLFIAWALARLIVHSPFGRSLVGIRENVTRMHAIGSPVFRRRLRIYAISAALAGIAGALLTETTQFVALQVLSFELSGTVLVMLILGGVGRLYGAFIGAPLYMIAQDQLARDNPAYWLFWIGLLLVVVVIFARGGMLGIVDRLRGAGR
jgi:branched-chain amino acid transport system permease protein